MAPVLLSLALTDLLRTLQLEGAAVADLSDPPLILHQAGLATPEVLPAAVGLLRRKAGPRHGITRDDRPLLTCPLPLPGGRPGGLILWRQPSQPGWQATDTGLATAIAGLVRVIMAEAPADHGLDIRTALPHRAPFLAAVDRHIARLDAAAGTGTLLLLSPDPSRPPHGRESRDDSLERAAHLLHAVLRPSDRIGRIAPDRLAAWLDHADHMTTAERAETIVRRRLPEPAGVPTAPRRTLSIGIASRPPGRGDSAAALLARATAAMEAVRREGGNGWRVAGLTLDC